jgi:hypothetical protein
MIHIERGGMGKARPAAQTGRGGHCDAIQSGHSPAPLLYLALLSGAMRAQPRRPRQAVFP